MVVCSFSMRLSLVYDSLIGSLYIADVVRCDKGLRELLNDPAEYLSLQF